jgi:integrase
VAPEKAPTRFRNSCKGITLLRPLFLRLYPAYVRNLLLTMTRRNESSELHTTELDGDVWKIPAERYKSKLDHVVPLSAMALENLRSAADAQGQGSKFLFPVLDLDLE